MAALPLRISHTNLFDTDEYNDFSITLEKDILPRHSLLDPQKTEGNSVDTVRDILNAGRYRARTYAATKGEEIDSGVISDYDMFKQQTWLENLLKPENSDRLLSLANKFNVDPSQISQFYHPELLNTYKNEIRNSVNKPTPPNYDPRKWEAEREQLLVDDRGTLDPRDDEDTLLQSAIEASKLPVGGVLPVIAGFFGADAEGAYEGMIDTRQRQENLVRYRGVREEDVNRGYVSEFIPASSLWRFIVSPNDLSIEETRNVLPPEQRNDPNLKIGYESKDDFGLGILISNDKTGNNPIPFRTINPLEQAVTLENLTPFVEQILIAGGQEFFPLISGGFVAKKTSDAFRDRAIKNVKEMAEGKEAFDDDLMEALGGIGIPGDQIPLVDNASDIFRNKKFMEKYGPKIEEALAVAATASGADVVTRWGMLLAGATLPLSEDGPVQPQLATEEGFLRLAKSSGLLFAYAFAADTVGEMLLSTVTTTWKAATGKRVPDATLEQLQVLAERYRQNLGIFSTTTKTGELKDLSEAEMQKVLGNWVDKNGAELAGKLDLRTFANLSQDEKLMGLQHWFLESLPEGDVAAASIERMFTAPESNLLDRFYTSIYQKLEDDQRKYLPSKKAINDHFQELKQNSKKGELTQAQTELVNAEAEIDVNKFLAERLSPTSRRESAARITDRAPSVDPMLMNKNPLFNTIKENYDTARGEFYDILETDEFTDVTVKIAADVKDPFRALVDADLNQVWASEDAIETALGTRAAVPGREGGLVNITSMLGEETAPPVPKFDALGKEIKPAKDAKGVKVPFREVPLGKIVEAIRDVDIQINQLGSTNPTFVKKLEEFRTALMKAADRGYKKQEKMFGESYKDQVGYAVTNINDLRDQVSGRYIAGLVEQGDSEIGSYLLGSRPKELEGYFDLIGQSEDGFSQVGDVRALVTDEIRREISLPMPNGADPTLLEMATRFRKLKADKEEQLKVIFGEEKLAEFSKFDDMFNSTRETIETNLKTVKDLQKALEKAETTRPTEAVDKFLNMNAEGRQLFEETPLRDSLIELSKLADENPELRKNLRSYFAGWLDTNLVTRPDVFKELSPDIRMRMTDKTSGWSGFDLDKLRSFALGYPNNQAFARDLALIIGKEDAKEYASALRVLAKRLELLNQKPTVRSSIAQKLLKDISGPERTFQRATMSPLSETTRKFTLGIDLINAYTQRNMALIMSDPKKIRQLNAQLAKETDVKTFLKVLTNIAIGRSAELGTEQNITELQQFIDGLDARSSTMLDAFFDDAAP